MISFLLLPQQLANILLTHMNTEFAAITPSLVEAV